jgi:hypothetical protein
MEAIKELKRLAFEERRRRFPNYPEELIYIKPYRDRKANDLTRCIIDFLTLHGHQAERIAVTVRYIDQSKIVKDCLRTRRKIGSGKWIASSMQKGSADLSATIKGRSVKIEIKIGRDRQSESQKQYQKQIEAAGGIYFIARNFEEFYNWYNDTF